MKSKLISFAVALCTSVSMMLSPLAVYAADTGKTVTSSDFSAEELRCDDYDIDKYTTPFWNGNVVYNEVVFPLSDPGGSAVPLSLMYEPTEIISVKNYTLTETYTYGKDYTLENGKLVINPRGSINRIHYSKIHPATNPLNKPIDEYYPRHDGNGYEYWNESSEISMMNLVVTYIHNDTWDAPTPPSIADDLPKTMSRLIHKEDLNIVVIGDSVSAGAKSSLQCGIAPFADAYPEMTAKALAKKFGNDNINLINKAIGGSTSDWSYERLNNTVIDHNPDLVIMAFGMNDSSVDTVGYSDAYFRSNIRGQINYIQDLLPECEILLLASVYGNPLHIPRRTL